MPEPNPKAGLRKRIANWSKSFFDAAATTISISTALAWAYPFVLAGAIALVFGSQGDLERLAQLSQSEPELSGTFYRLYFIAGLITSLSVVFVIAATYFHRRYYRTKKITKKQHTLIEQYKKTGDEFMKLSHLNAICDKTLFEKLFLIPINDCVGRPLPTGIAIALKHAEKTIEDNLLANLDFLKFILDEFTGKKCSVNIKILYTDETGSNNPLDLLSKTIMRDTDSKYDRSKRNDIIHIKDDLAHTHVINHASSVFACSDLRSSNYFTGRLHWQDYYNSIIVCGIQSLAPEGNGILTRALLSVDSLDADLSDKNVESCVREFANRIAILMYRLDVLGTVVNGEGSE